MPPLLEYILQEYGSNPFEAFWFIFGHGGALVFIPVSIRLAIKGWLFWNNEHFKHHTPHTIYKIDVPQNNEQSMKAVEQIYAQLYGTYKIPDWYEKWWLGFVQEEFSFEIVSDGGYITFYVRSPRYYKEVLQAAFYSHYPDAILTEVEDYTKDINVDMINSGKVKVWGAEMKLEAEDCRPIKPYPGFEHSLPGKAIDPIANMLEFMSRMQPGEKIWYQVMIQPTSLPHLKELAKEAIDKVVEPTGVHHGPDIVDRIQAFVMGLLQYLDKALFGGEVSTAEHEEGGLQERQRLTTPEREFVEEVDRKASRWPYHSKVRYMYFTSPALYDEKKVHRGMFGALRLFRFINALEEGNLTRTEWKALQWRYFYPKKRLLKRARRMFWAYRSRDMERGEHEGFILSTEEITSLCHFPTIDVRAPFVAKVYTRGVEPPTLLQYEEAAAAGGPSVRLEGGALGMAAPVRPQPNMPTVVAESVTSYPPSGSAQPPLAPTPPEPPAAAISDPDLSGPPPPANIPFV